MRPGARAVLLLIATGACSAHRGPAPTRLPAPDTSGAAAFLEDTAALAHAALLYRPLPGARLPLRPYDDEELIYREEDGGVPTGATRRIIYAATRLQFADGGSLHVAVLLGPTGFRVGRVVFQDHDPPPVRLTPELAPLQASLAAIASVLKGGRGSIPWFTAADVEACGIVPACVDRVTLVGAPVLGGLADRIASAGEPGGVVVGEMGAIEIASDGRVFHIAFDQANDSGTIRRITVKQIEPL